MAAISTSLCTLALLSVMDTLRQGAPLAWYAASFALIVLLPALITFLAANKLTNAIRALRSSTEAIVRGDFNSPVSVDCACEVGGLADSFRAMVYRLNSNILRMNVLAYSDAVTGLPNRAVITHVLGLVRQQQARAECRGALLFIDLDGFKRVNDTLGHEAGDLLLRMVSDRIIREGLGLSREDIDDCTTAFGELRATCPSRPVFARFAGDEFVVLLPGEQDTDALAHIAGRILQALQAAFNLAGNEVHTTASIGIARHPADTEDAEQLLSCADIAMYAAKEGGRNQCRFFDASLKALVFERSRIEADLRRAIEADELTLHFQPKLHCHTLAMKGVEALVRWQHPDGGMIPPSKFIAIAEQNGLMSMLGASIMRLAVRQQRAWQEQGRRLRVAVNVSAVQFERPGLVQDVLGMLQAHGVPPAQLELEITESMLMADFNTVQRRIEQLQAAGVHISVDDFGTGYSNLSQLAKLPSNVLKMDKSLIDGIGHNPKAEAIIAATVGMAHALGHRVVAEGVETKQQHAFLARTGCDEVQGFLFARPMPAAQLEAWMDQHGEQDARRAA